MEICVVHADAVGDGEDARLFGLFVAGVEHCAIRDERVLHVAIVVERAPVFDRLVRAGRRLFVFECEHVPRLGADVVARRVLILIGQVNDVEVYVLLLVLVDEEFRKAANDSKDQDVRSFAGKTLFTLEEHLRMARALENPSNAKKGSVK